MNLGILKYLFLGVGAVASLVVSVIEGVQNKKDIAEEVTKQLNEREKNGH